VTHHVFWYIKAPIKGGTNRYKYQAVVYQNEMSDESHNHVCGVAQRDFHGRFAAYVERWEQEREE